MTSVLYSYITQFNFLLRHHHQSQNVENLNSSTRENDKEYYNDLPNKLPPDLMNDNDMQENQQLSNHQKLGQLNLKKSRDRLSSNLIDLNSPPPDQTSNKINLNVFDPLKSNMTIAQQQSLQQPPDVFDIRNEIVLFEISNF